MKGVQRVPSLLLTNPSQSLEDLNLQNYTILDCELLHDLNGHLSNHFDELPHILEKPLAEDVSAILNVHLHTKETKRGGDYRLAAIHVLALLRQTESTPALVLKLVETAVVISEIMYADKFNSLH